MAMVTVKMTDDDFLRFKKVDHELQDALKRELELKNKLEEIKLSNTYLFNEKAKRHSDFLMEEEKMNSYIDNLSSSLKSKIKDFDLKIEKYEKIISDYSKLFDKIKRCTDFCFYGVRKKRIMEISKLIEQFNHSK